MVYLIRWSCRSQGKTREWLWIWVGNSSRFSTGASSAWICTQWQACKEVSFWSWLSELIFLLSSTNFILHSSSSSKSFCFLLPCIASLGSLSLCFTINFGAILFKFFFPSFVVGSTNSIYRQCLVKLWHRCHFVPAYPALIFIIYLDILYCMFNMAPFLFFIFLLNSRHLTKDSELLKTIINTYNFCRIFWKLHLYISSDNVLNFLNV